MFLIIFWLKLLLAPDYLNRPVFDIHCRLLIVYNSSSVGAVRDAIDTLKSNNVNAFVLDLRDNR